MAYRNIMNRCVRTILYLLFLIAVPVSAQNSRKELENRKKKLQQEIRATNQLIEETKKTRSLSLNELKILNRKLENRKKLINTIQAEINLLNSSITTNTRKINNLKSDLNRLKADYGRHVRIAYMNRSRQGEMMMVLSSEDVPQAFKRMHYLRTFNEERRKQAELIQVTQRELAEYVNRQSTDLSTKKVLLSSEEKEKTELSQEKQQKEQVVTQLQKKEKDLRKDLAKKQADAKKLDREIQKVIEREIALERERALAKAKSAAPKSSGTAAATPAAKEKAERELRLTPEALALSGKFEANKGRLPWPVEKGAISESFGTHPHPVLKNITTYNNGIDISTTKGASVKSIFEGEVSGIISIPGANMAVIVKHGEYLTVYSNLASVSVSRGTKVKTGQVLGIAASDENENRAETHLEIWKGKMKLDPEHWIAR